LNNGGDPDSFLSHQRSYRINSWFMRDNCHFGTGPGLAGDCLDFHRTGSYFRNFDFKKFPQKFWMGTRQENSRTFRVFFNQKQKNLQAISNAIALIRNLLLGGKHPDRSSYVYEYIPALDPLHHSGNKFSFFGFVLIKYCLSFGFADSLDYYLLRSLRRDSSKLIFVFQRKLKLITGVYIQFYGARFINHHVFLRIEAHSFFRPKDFFILVPSFRLFPGSLRLRKPCGFFRFFLGHLFLRLNHGFVYRNLNLAHNNLARCLIQGSADNLSALAVIALIGGGKRHFNGLEYFFLRD